MYRVPETLGSLNHITALIMGSSVVRAYVFACSLCARWSLRALPAYTVPFVWVRNPVLKELRISPKVTR